MHGLGWVDCTIFGVVIVSILIGLFRGFVKEALSLVNWVLAIWMGVIFHEKTSAWFVNLIENETIRSIAAFGVVFVFMLFIGSIITYFISLMVRKSGLGGTDRLLGIVFGITRGIFLVGLTLTVVSYSTLKEQPWWQDSVIIPRFKPLMAWLNDIVPDRINVAKDAVFVKPAKYQGDNGSDKMAAVGIEDLGELKLLEDED